MWGAGTRTTLGAACVQIPKGKAHLTPSASHREVAESQYVPVVNAQPLIFQRRPDLTPKA